jgi:hypothetical protein
MEWRDVVGFEGIYEISRLGDVRSIDRVIMIKKIVNFGTEIKETPRKRKGKDIRIFRIGRGGPLGVRLAKNKLFTNLTIKELMTAAWPDVDYSDEDRKHEF